ETLYVNGEEGGGTSTDETTTDTTASTDAIVDSSSSSSSMGFVPVRKMKRTPYNAGGVLLNRLYIARDGDSMSSVAEKIYGDGSRKRDLQSWNSSLAGRSLKVGDKIYYNSPRNPADSSQVLLYYEEAGIQPQMYTAKSGDSIRKVSQSLLGHSRSWMEIWATNEVESKWQMQEGTTLRYWPSGSVGSVPVQQAATEEAAPAETAAPADDMGAPPEGGQNVASNTEEMGAPTEDMPPGDEQPPGDDLGAGAQVAQNEEPPPPPSDMAPPPPPPTDAVAPPDAPADSGGIAGLMSGQDDTTMIAVLGGLLLIAAFILLIFLKRGRKKVNYS
ncbi:MAG: LysM peptidoglycan-binding domain-containing protein, partial [Bdellovibrionaceae bacterium]|nr:LysM peptidoglycan-binding domain-containing protein [Pseudobdellovibrionaceae bacterium]